MQSVEDRLAALEQMVEAHMCRTQPLHAPELAALERRVTQLEANERGTDQILIEHGARIAALEAALGIAAGPDVPF